MSTKHTPGPWRYIAQAPSKLDHVGTAMVATTHSGGLAIDCHGSGRSWEEDAANARLCAAAPLMLETLQWLDAIGGLGLTPHQRIEDAIKAATGGKK